MISVCVFCCTVALFVGLVRCCYSTKSPNADSQLSSVHSRHSTNVRVSRPSNDVPVVMMLDASTSPLASAPPSAAGVPAAAIPAAVPAALAENEFAAISSASSSSVIDDNHQDDIEAAVPAAALPPQNDFPLPSEPLFGAVPRS